jgi:hypothetical protein
MNNFLEELRKYFENTPQDKILEDWSKSAEFDNVGPSVEEYLLYSKQFDVLSKDTNDYQQIITNKFGPEYTSGFFNL